MRRFHFNNRIVLRTTSLLLLFEGIAMLVPFVYAVAHKEIDSAVAFFFTLLCCCAFGLCVYKFLKHYDKKTTNRDAFFIVLLSWTIMGLIGSIPYIFSNCGCSFSDGIFESFASWTTTGAHVLNYNLLPKSLILWKSECNWLGGMGAMMLLVSVFPLLGVSGQKMAAAEVPGPELEKFSAHIGDMGRIAYSAYMILTLIEFLLLLPSGWSVFDAATNTLSTISTAGVINTHGNVGITFTPYIKTILTVFSMVGSINFILYFFLFRRRFMNACKNVELRFYICSIIVASAIMSVLLTIAGTYDSFFDALGNALVQSVSFGSTSGFTVSALDLWPTSCKVILLALMLMGGCAFSTSGGLKTIRVIVFFKLILRGVYKRIHPNATRPIMIANKPVSAPEASSITVFLMLFFVVFLLSSLLISLENLDMETTLSATAALFTNNGTGFSAMSAGDYSLLSPLGKLFASVIMLMGRLEIYAVLLLFSRSFWNPARAVS